MDKTESGVALCWHHDESNSRRTSEGRVKMLFSPDYSIKGVVMMASRRPKKRKLGGAAAIDEILGGGTIANRFRIATCHPEKQSNLDRRDPKNQRNRTLRNVRNSMRDT